MAPDQLCRVVYFTLETLKNKYSPIIPKFSTMKEQTIVDFCAKGFVIL